MATMYDSTSPSYIPAGAEIIAGYVDGAYGPSDPWGSGWTAASWDQFPQAKQVRIATSASTDTGDVLDVEQGDATPAQAPGWVQMRRRAGHRWATVYCSEWSWANQVVPAFQAAGVPEPFYWVADTSNGPAIPAGACAIQYQQNPTTGCDVSETDGVWPPIGPGPAQPPLPSPSEEVPMAVSRQVTFRSGQVDVFQVSAGALWHKWNDLSNTAGWGNESVGAAVGLSGVTFVGQPEVDTTSRPGCVVVTVEDSGGRAWYFLQGQTGGWNVNQLP